MSDRRDNIERECSGIEVDMAVAIGAALPTNEVSALARAAQARATAQVALAILDLADAVRFQEGGKA